MKNWIPKRTTRGRENGQPWISYSPRWGWQLRMLTHKLKTLGGHSTRVVKTFETFEECKAAAYTIPPEYQPAWWPFDYFTEHDVIAVERGSSVYAIVADIQNGSRGTYKEQAARIELAKQTRSIRK